MITEHDAVSSEEFVFRRVPNGTEWIDLVLPRPVQATAFRPTDGDTDGISVFRELFTSAREVANSGRYANGYYVIKIPVRKILDVGLTVIPDPDDEQLPGHSLIPEINSLKRTPKDAKKELRRLQEKLTKIVNDDYRNLIVHHPL